MSSSENPVPIGIQELADIMIEELDIVFTETILGSTQAGGRPISSLSNFKPEDGPMVDSFCLPRNPFVGYVFTPEAKSKINTALQDNIGKHSNRMDALGATMAALLVPYMHEATESRRNRKDGETSGPSRTLPVPTRFFKNGNEQGIRLQQSHDYHDLQLSDLEESETSTKAGDEES